jgi:circadian clock protein KaiC
MSEVETINSDMASTGIEGLDYILKGGLSKNRLYLVQGNPGTGKTTMGLQFFSKASGKRKGLYITCPKARKN